MGSQATSCQGRPSNGHGVGFCHRFVNTLFPADATAEKRCETATKEAIAKISNLGQTGKLKPSF